MSDVKGPDGWPVPASIAVNWSDVARKPERKSFIDEYGPANVDEAEAQRAASNIVIEAEPAGQGQTPAPLRNFADLSILPEWMKWALDENKWEAPLPVQAQALPILLSGRSLIGIAQTGSGKTIAFLIPMIVHASAQRSLSRAEPGPIGLCLAPTRELAVQISDQADLLCKYSSRSSDAPSGIRSVCFYGGGRKADQMRSFTADGSHIVVATPGRLLDFCGEKRVVLSRVTFLVLDEADRMLEMGFQGDMEQISSAIRPERQMAFFSATWSKEVQSLAVAFCSETPVTIRVGGAQGSGEAEALTARKGITQEVVVVDFPGESKPWIKQEEEKNKLLHVHIKAVFQDQQAKMILFVNQKNFAEELSSKLWDEGIYVDTLHGGRQQDDRLAVLDKFRQGNVRLLIATDVMGRGLDVQGVTHVVVYSMGGVEDYIHRIGRTGRGKDAKGHALVFFEYSPKYPDWAKDLIAVLVQSEQTVPPALVQIAADVASGKRPSHDSWSQSSGNGGGWKGNSWNGSGGGGDGSQGWSNWKSYPNESASNTSEVTSWSAVSSVAPSPPSQPAPLQLRSQTSAPQFGAHPPHSQFQLQPPAPHLGEQPPHLQSVAPPPAPQFGAQSPPQFGLQPPAPQFGAQLPPQHLGSQPPPPPPPPQFGVQWPPSQFWSQPPATQSEVPNPLHMFAR